MARNPRTNAGTVPVINKIGSTLGDTNKTASIVDAVYLDRGAVAFRGIEAGPGIEITVVDADNNRFTTADKKIVIRNVGPGAGEANTASNLGSGQGIFSNKVGSNLRFKSLVAGAGVNLTSTATEITINSTGTGVANLGDLLDVTFPVSPAAGDALIFDGSVWTAQPGGAGEVNTGQNVGLGFGVFKQKTGAVLEFKSLIAGSNIDIVESNDELTLNVQAGEANVAQNLGGDESLVGGKVGQALLFKGLTAGPNVQLQEAGDGNSIIISVPTVGETNSGQNIGPGSNVFAQKSGSFLQFRSLVAGSNINLSQAADHIVISSTQPGEINFGVNLGSGTGVYAQKFNEELRFKSLVAGTNVNITSDSDTITISAAAAGEANTASNVGSGQDVFKQKVGANLEFRRLLAGTNTTIGLSGDSVLISSVGDISNAQSLGTGVPVWQDKVGNNLRFRSLRSSTPGSLQITTSPDLSEVWFSNIAEANTASNVGAGEGLFLQKVGTDLQFKSISAGGNITVTDLGNTIEISTTATAGEVNTASNIGLGSGLFEQKIGTDLQFRSLIAGANISFTETAGDITINSTAVGEINDAVNIGIGEELFAQKVGTELQFKTLVASGNIIINDLGDELEITTSAAVGEANTASNIGTGVGVFAQKVGVDLEFKSFTAGSNKVQVVDDIINDVVELDIIPGNINTSELNNDANFLQSGDNISELVNDAGYLTSVSLDDLTDVNNPGPLTDGVGYVLEWDSINNHFNLVDGSVSFIFGQNNDGLNVGAGAEVFKDKQGVNLRFRTLVEGSNISITEDTDEIVIGLGNIQLDDLDDVNIGSPGAAEDGYALSWNNATSSFVLSAISATPGGANTQIQFNDNGLFGGDSGFTTNGNGSVNIIGDLGVDDLYFDGNTVSVDNSPNVNEDLVLRAKGTGYVVSPIGYDMSTGPDEAYVTKGYLQSGNINNEINIGNVLYSQKSDIVLLAGQTNTNTTITYDTSFRTAYVDYGVERGSNYRTGTLMIVNNGTVVSISDAGTDIGSIDITFSASIIGSDVVINYTSTAGINAEMHYQLRKFEF